MPVFINIRRYSSVFRKRGEKTTNRVCLSLFSLSIESGAWAQFSQFGLFAQKRRECPKRGKGKGYLGYWPFVNHQRHIEGVRLVVFSLRHHRQTRKQDSASFEIVQAATIHAASWPQNRNTFCTYCKTCIYSLALSNIARSSKDVPADSIQIERRSPSLGLPWQTLALYISRAWW